MFNCSPDVPTGYVKRDVLTVSDYEPVVKMFCSFYTALHMP